MVTPADIVADPSGPNCWVSAVNEKKEWAFNSDGEIYEKAIHEINKATTKGRIDELKLLCAFENILETIVKKK